MDFIRTYPKVIDDYSIDALIEMANNSITWTKGWSRERNDVHRKDKQVALQIDPVNQGLNNYINECLLEKVFEPYAEEFGYLKSIKEWTSAVTILTKIEPSEGYHSWHCEDLTYDCQQRHLAWMIYLNDIEEGGETEFLYQQKKIKPRRGMGAIWPGSFTHLHRGNPPITAAKYTLTGWFIASQGRIAWG